MFKRLAGLVLLVSGLASGLAAPAFAQTASEQCVQAHRTFHAAAVVVSQQGQDVAGALAARAGLAPQEQAAHAACDALGYQYSMPIDISKEELDISLAGWVPACKVFMERAIPHIATAPKLKLVPREAQLAIDALKLIRSEASEPCKDYPGVLSRILRVENDLVFSLPRGSSGRGG